MTEHLTYPPHEVWTLELDEVSLTGDDIMRELGRIPTCDDTLEYPHPNSARKAETSTNWGASGSFGEYVLDVSVNLMGGLGAVGVAALVQTIFSRIAKSSNLVLEPLSRNEAGQLLKSHLALHYGVSVEELTEQQSAMALDEGVVSFRFVTSDGTLYGGSVGALGESRCCTRVWRERPTA
jgi:hypothetical protein